VGLPGRGHGLVRQPDLLHGGDEADGRHADPAPLLGNEHAEQAELPHLTEEVRRAARLVPGQRGPGRDLLFAIVLLQLMVMPDVLLVGNYRTVVQLHLADSILAIALPYLGSAFGIFLLRQTFLTIPQPLDDAARLEGCGLLARLWRVYVPLAKPTYIAYGLVSVSYHWNNFLWPLVITNSVTTRPLTVGLAVFATTDQGIDWSIVTAATLMTSAPLLIAFLLFQRQFVQSFMRAGIR